MASKPILFSTPMVQAILDGKKTQTRRVIIPQPDRFFEVDDTPGNFHLYDVEWGLGRIYPKYQVGDILWVRETWATVSSGIIEYKATYIEPYTGSTEIDHIGKKITWRPSIHMPREAARIFLRVTNVRVERLREITDTDCLSEGIKDHPISDLWNEVVARVYGDTCEDTPIKAFEKLWNSTIKKQDIDKYGWDANPWVWVYEFERVSEDGSS
jgi:hypothetical protein